MSVFIFYTLFYDPTWDNEPDEDGGVAGDEDPDRDDDVCGVARETDEDDVEDETGL